jgi:hypothetical protein
MCLSVCAHLCLSPSSSLQAFAHDTTVRASRRGLSPRPAPSSSHRDRATRWPPPACGQPPVNNGYVMRRRRAERRINQHRCVCLSAVCTPPRPTRTPTATRREQQLHFANARRAHHQPIATFKRSSWSKRTTSTPRRTTTFALSSPRAGCACVRAPSSWST